jgi:hypothetical protein
MPPRNGSPLHVAPGRMVSHSKFMMALLGLAAFAPAQFRIEGSLGRHIQVGLQLGARCAPRDRSDCDDRHSRRGRWEMVCEQVWVEGYWHEEHVPARYGWICDPCGHRHWGIVEPEHCHRVYVPGHYETRQRRVWVRC